MNPWLGLDAAGHPQWVCPQCGGTYWGKAGRRYYCHGGAMPGRRLVQTAGCGFSTHHEPPPRVALGAHMAGRVLRRR